MATDHILETHAAAKPGAMNCRFTLTDPITLLIAPWGLRVFAPESVFTGPTQAPTTRCLGTGDPLSGADGQYAVCWEWARQASVL